MSQELKIYAKFKQWNKKMGVPLQSGASAQ